jgi:hypothetical protein
MREEGDPECFAAADDDCCAAGTADGDGADAFALDRPRGGDGGEEEESELDDDDDGAAARAGRRPLADLTAPDLLLGALRDDEAEDAARWTTMAAKCC